MSTVLIIIGLALLIFVHEAGHFVSAKLMKMKVEEFGFGFPPRLWGKKIGETLYSVNALPFGGFVRLLGEDEETKTKGGFMDQPFRRRMPVLLAGVLMNFVIGWFLFSVVFMAGAPRHLAIADVLPDSPAYTAGIKSGDIVTEAVIGSETLKDPIDVAVFVNAVRRSAAPNVALTILRGKDSHVLTVTKRVNPPAGEGALGVSLAEIGIAPQPFFGSFLSGIGEAWNTVVLVVQGLVQFIGGLFMNPGATIQEVAGPVGIVFLASQAGALGFVYFLNLLALISINLAVLNLIPFPALDGGRALFLIIEKIKGSPVSKKLQIIVNGAGFAVLIALMVLVTIQDISRVTR